jgi:uncharacterized membrane protein
VTFAIALPWWALALIVAAVAAIAWASYAGAIVPLSPRRRGTIVGVRAVTLLLVVACLLRPVRLLPPDSASDTVVPVLVDVSRSMGLADVAGRRRIEAAAEIVGQRVVPALRGVFATEVWTFGDALVRRAGPSGPGASSDSAGEWPSPAGRGSDLSGALREVRERYRQRRLAGIIVISDGGDTGAEDASGSVDDRSVPVFAIGVGATRIESDFEVVDVSAGDLILAESSIDLTVTAVNRGSATPFDLRLLENGRSIDLRRVIPVVAGSPVHAVFTVSPPRDTATVYTVEIPSAAGELVLENNRRSVIVEPPAGSRRILMIEGAPGFEHSFLKRALAADPGLEVDSVVRKGRDGRGDATYFVSASADRAPLLTSGFPNDRAALYGYDAIVLANIEPDALVRTQLELLADFVGERGGGLLVLGAKSLAQRGLAGTALEEVLPMTLAGHERRDAGAGHPTDTHERAVSDAVRTSADGGDRFGVRLTSEGAAHPVMRIGATAEQTGKRWASVPPLAGASAFGAARPGAQVLALIRTANGDMPLVAVQRYGHGRSMVFTGEASWRWRMHLPSSERTYELFWRQSARWLTAATPRRLSVGAPAAPAPGDSGSVTVDVRDEDFAPLTDAQVSVRLTTPDGRSAVTEAALVDARAARYSSHVRFDQEGIYHIVAEARRGTALVGAAERWMNVGGVDRELAEPRLNEEVLRRIARASGGSYVTEAGIPDLPSLLASAGSVPAPPRLQELWHDAWIFALVIMLLTTEWMLRRRWGLR